MADDILNTIDVLTARVTAKEEEANKLKKLVNELCGEAGIPTRYANIAETGGATTIRSDQFYGLPLTAAIRNYLEIRKASNLGAATLTEIFRAIRDGGYKFDTKNEENARIGVGNALRKTTSVFHRLPNGEYGLLAWYPSAKAPPQGTPAVKRGRPGKKQTNNAGKRTEDAGSLSNKDIRDAALAQSGNFQGADIEKALKAQHPTKSIPSARIPTVLFLLKKAGLIKVAVPRSGKIGAIFCKA
jgi:hypothetical protein